jgi:acyl carrier protein
MSVEQQLEQVVTRHWINICGYEQVTANDDFFELGGTSLQAAEVVAAIQSLVGDEVQLMAAFFEEPTVAAMVRAIVETLNPDELAALAARIAT